MPADPPPSAAPDPTRSVACSPLGPGPSGRKPIKGNVKRTVFHEQAADGSGLMVKVFHAPGIGALRDRSRAKREARHMRMARAAGLPVAEVLSVSRFRGAWSLAARWIPGAQPLDAVLDAARRGRAEGGARRRRAPLARALGRLVARAQAVGFVHGDPHPGNILVAGDGQLWIADLSGSRLARARASVIESIERGASALRESDGRFLITAYRSWRKEAENLGLGPLPGPDAIDLAAQGHRLTATARRVRVWRRTSTPTFVAEEDGRPVARVRDAEAPPAQWCTQRTEYDSRAEAEQVWNHLVRARLHRLPAARPVSASLAPPWHVEYSVPPGAAPTSDLAGPELRALLRHRGLSVRGPLLQDRAGDSLIGPGALLTEERAR